MDVFLRINLIAFIIVVLWTGYLFTKIIAARIAYIKLGKRSEFDGAIRERLSRFIKIVFGQTKLLKDKRSGIIHIMMFYGFILVQLGALDFFIKGLAPGKHLPIGPFYPGFIFFQEIVAVLILIAVYWAFHRRYIEKLNRLNRDFKAGLVLIFIGLLMLTVLFGNGLLEVWQGAASSFTIASMIASGLSFLTPKIAMVLFFSIWWVHTLTILIFLIYIPQSKHAHLIAAPINVFISKQNPGKLEKIDFEAIDETDEDLSFGVGKVEDFTQFQLMDLYSCVECGRCTDVCPASQTGKLLSPMHLMLKIRDHLTEKAAAVTGKSAWIPATAFASPSEMHVNQSLIGDVITEAEINACTTCRSCEEACPVMNEHVDKIIDLRRYLVLTEGKVDKDLQRVTTNIERQGNPWGLTKKDRIKWREHAPIGSIPTVDELKKEDKSFDYLFWVSSMGAYDARSQKIAVAFCRLMNEAGISFAILGNKEANSGDTARRVGNEFLFQEIAAKNIAEFEKYDVKKIVTIDPHAYNIFKNEYPDFGLDVEVLHHTQLLYDLLEDQRINCEQPINERITYHDSCYLGRYNGVYDPPREILKKIPGLELVEMTQTKENAMCCGAGGGLMWTEETGTRINLKRTEQALETEPAMILSGCPYCLTMLQDGVKATNTNSTIETMDVAEIIALSVFSEVEIQTV